MSNELVAKRYALALFQLANEQNMVDQIEDQLLVVKQVFVENKDLLELLTHPKVELETKKQMVSSAFAGLVPFVQNTLFLLLERHRVHSTVGVINEYVTLANEARGIAQATVYSVKPLSEDEEKALSGAFARKVGKQSLRISNVVDKSLIGGVKLRIGNRIYDGSIHGKLERIHRELLANRS
ncbi:F0F1 ATP synthase subunit delta [Bacillus sp. CGMCC 1.16541]|uniref:F0F1 ATP synthase subunit delta n=1 Tax=Bacillus sp. CGMCC 1.16541 TaxID=2185143 RepID=UPI000D733B7F|nr:F0F1 ATP synthase subunit delta [Bacillus sp. CGMCC 1.16541]